MYSLASCGIYATFKVENTLQININKKHSQYVCAITTLNKYIRLTYNYMRTVIEYTAPLLYSVLLKRLLVGTDHALTNVIANY